MNIIDITLVPTYYISIKLNWLALLVLCAALVGISYLIKKVIPVSRKHAISVQEITLGIGNSSITVHYDNRDRAIAYKLWVELNTRKIGLEFDQENDVIVEVYDSWYEYFRVARELIKDLPIEKIECASELIELATKVLNQGLRPHLTKWQARYRKWYESSVKESDAKLSPQDIQKQYPYYDELLSDLIETSKRMIAYKELMYQIAFHKT